MFFGFTHCPEICPTTLYRLSSIAEADAADQLGIIFVTVDPERDTAAYLADYISICPQYYRINRNAGSVGNWLITIGCCTES